MFTEDRQRVISYAIILVVGLYVLVANVLSLIFEK